MRNRRFNNRKPLYIDDSDYTTNSPSYYDHLARLNKLLQLLSERIWDYEDELNDRFDEWDKLIEEFPDEVLKLLIKWLNDGTLKDLIDDLLYEKINNEIKCIQNELFNLGTTKIFRGY